MDDYMKKFLVVLFFTGMTAFMIGCGEENKSIDLSEVFEEIKEEIAADYGGDLQGLVEIDLTENEEDPLQDMILDETGLADEEMIENGYILASAMNVNSDAIILLEAKEEDDISSLEEGLEEYLEFQHGVWEIYLPDQFEKVENTIIESKGKYIIYITSENPENIKEIFEDAF